MTQTPQVQEWTSSLPLAEGIMGVFSTGPALGELGACDCAPWGWGTARIPGLLHRAAVEITSELQHKLDLL